ncbi:MAG: DUF3152 domain-containing protein [Aeromicrobium sp.]
MRARVGSHRRSHPLKRATAGTSVALVLGLALAGVQVAIENRPSRESDDGVASALSAASLPRVQTPPLLPRPPGREPTRARVPDRASGTFSLAAGVSKNVGSGQIIAYRVEVENGIPYDATTFAQAVDRTLADRRGWIKSGHYGFARRAQAARRIVLASPKTVDRLCAPLETRGEVSCRNGDVIAINAKRWASGAATYRGDLSGYRIHVMNHEVGHSLGLAHAACPGSGQVAPVMLQQTLGLDDCEKNPWP